MNMTKIEFDRKMVSDDAGYFIHTGKARKGFEIKHGEALSVFFKFPEGGNVEVSTHGDSIHIYITDKNGKTRPIQCIVSPPGSDKLIIDGKR